jgi:hypothetical protein
MDAGTDTDDQRSPAERRIAESFEDTAGLGKPLSRRARQTRRSVEAYLNAGVVPRYMQRLREVDAAVEAHRLRIERSYRRLRELYGDDAEAFTRRWRTRAGAFRFDAINQLIREHNEWYPIEAQLPIDPRTGDYVGIRGRRFRRRELDLDWVLEQFPAAPT